MDLPSRFAVVILAFAPVFRQQRTWRHAERLLIGAILAPGKRTVTGLLRIVGLSRARRFVNYHRVLGRAVWDARAASHLLLELLIAAFVPVGPVVLGIDDTIERRRGQRISAEGIYRDPVRSSKGPFVKASGLRWLSLTLLAPVPWAGRVWALPFLTALAPSERCCRERGRRHKKLTDWARRMGLQARRWLPGREVVLLGDSSFAALDLLAALARRQGLACTTRLRLDAASYGPAPPRRPGTVGRPRTKGARLPNLSAVLADAGTRWVRVVVPGWYGEGERTVEVCSATAAWRHAGLPVVPIRWVLLRDPHSAPVRPAGAAVHRSGARPAADRALVRPALAGGGHLPGGPGSSRPRDTAAVVGSGDRPYHAVPARAVLDRDPARRAPGPPCTRGRVDGCLVPQAAPDVHRHPRRRPTAVLVRAGFAAIVALARPDETPARGPDRYGPRPLPRRLMAKVQLRAPCLVERSAG